MDTFGTFPSVRLIEVVKTVQCLLTLYFQRLLCTVIKFHVVIKEAIQRSSSLLFITNFGALFTNMRILKLKSQVTIAFFAAVSHLNGPLVKQNFTLTSSKGHGL